MARRARDCHSGLITTFPNRDAVDIVRFASRDLNFLFDDMVFSATSFFDYVSALFMFIISMGARLSAKWGDLCQWAESARTKYSPVSTKVLELNAGWVREFRAYRHALIHQENDSVRGSYSINLRPQGVTVRAEFLAPQRFATYLSKANASQTDQVDLRAPTRWILGQVFDATVDLANLVTSDLGFPSPRLASASMPPSGP